MPAPVPKRRFATMVAVLAAVIAIPLVVGATNRFDDVPNSNVHHDNITWLADVGVTVGCNPPANDEYCPDDSVSRAQMATFMRRLAENQVVDAGSLDGNGADAYRSIARADVDGDLSGGSVGVATELNSLTVSAPAPGVIIVSGSALLINQTGADDVPLGLRPSVNGSPLPGSGGNGAFDVFLTGESEVLGYTVAFEVPAGTHVVAQTASVIDGFSGLPVAGDFFYNANTLTAEWHPEGAVALATAGSGDGGILGD